MNWPKFKKRTINIITVIYAIWWLNDGCYPWIIGVMLASVFFMTSMFYDDKLT